MPWPWFFLAKCPGWMILLCVIKGFWCLPHVCSAFLPWLNDFGGHVFVFMTSLDKTVSPRRDLCFQQCPVVMCPLVSWPLRSKKSVILKVGRLATTQMWPTLENHLTKKTGIQFKNKVSLRTKKNKADIRKPDKNWNAKAYARLVAQKVCVNKGAFAIQTFYAPNTANYSQHKFKNGINLVQVDSTYPAFSSDGSKKLVSKTACLRRSLRYRLF